MRSGAGRFVLGSFALAALALGPRVALAQAAPAASAAPAAAATAAPEDVNIHFKNGTTYSGDATVGYPKGGSVSPASSTSSVQFVNGKPPSRGYSLTMNGQGKITYADGSTLSGTFVNGVLDGPDGEYVKPGSFDYKGAFSQGQPTQGTVSFDGGPTYEGTFGPDGLPGGQGTLTATGPVTEVTGTWSKGVLTNGYEILAGGSRFDGSFGSDGKPNGNGTSRSAGGTTLAGTWQDGLLSGPMVETYRDGTVLRVDVSPPSPTLQGKSTVVFPNRDKAAGTLISAGVFQGPGSYTFRDGTQLRGTYHNGLMGGAVTRVTPGGHTETGRIAQGPVKGERQFVAAAVPGVFVGPHGPEYFGSNRGHEEAADLRNFNGPVDALGRPNGSGSYTLAGGGKLSGKWLHGQLQAPATFTFANGDRASAKLQHGSLRGPGTYVYASTGFRIDGTFDDGRLKGPATLTTPDGDRYVGRMVNGTVQ